MIFAGVCALLRGITDIVGSFQVNDMAT